MALTSGQQRALDLAISGKNIFITGSGGVGKSFLIEEIIERLKAQKKNVLVTASTAKAAIVIKGITCHRAFGIPINGAWKAIPSIRTSSPVYETDVVIIDEISMLRMDAFELAIKYIEQVNKIRKDDGGKKKSIQIIVAGDFCQLPPVIKRKQRYKDTDVAKLDEGMQMSEYYGFDVGEGYAFLSDAWKRCNFTVCELTEVIRQSEKDLISIFNRIRFGDFSALAYLERCVIPVKEGKSFDYNSDTTYLCGTNDTAEKINKTALSKISGCQQPYDAKCTCNLGEVITKQDKQYAPEHLDLKCGAHVVMLVNTADYHNGSNAIVTDISSKDYISVRLSETGEVVVVPYYTWPIEKYIVVEKDGKKSLELKQIGTYSQLPIRLAYALTIHKAQGQTLSKVVLMIGTEKSEMFSPGQFYVGISRVKNIKNLKIKGNLNTIKVLADKTVLDFYGKTPIAASEVTFETKVEEKETPKHQSKRRQKKEANILKTNKEVTPTKGKQQRYSDLFSETKSEEKKVPKHQSKKKSKIETPKEKEAIPTKIKQGYVAIKCPKAALKVAWSYAHIRDTLAELDDDVLYVTPEKASSIQNFVDKIAITLR